MSPPENSSSSAGVTVSPPNGPPRYNVLGVGVSELTLASACDLVLAARNSRRLGYVCVTPVHAVSEARAEHKVAGLRQRERGHADAEDVVAGRWRHVQS